MFFYREDAHTRFLKRFVQAVSTIVFEKLVFQY